MYTLLAVAFALGVVAIPAVDDDRNALDTPAIEFVAVTESELGLSRTGL